MAPKYSVHLAQVDDRPGLIITASFFCVMTIAAIGLRFYARRVTGAGRGADDWLALTALIFVLALDGLFLGGTIQGAITGHSPVKDDWPVSTPLEHLVEKYKYGFQTIEKITLGLIKLSILFLWKRMFGHVRLFRILCWLMIVAITAWSLAFFFATLFQCGTEWTWNWAPITLFLTQCTNTLDMLTVFTATDVLTDFIIMFMPVPIIWKLNMPMRRKIGVISIFMVGLFTIGAGIGRMYIYLVTSYDKEDNPDFIADFTLFILWSEIAANVAIVVCCMPTLSPVVARCFEGLTAIMRSHSFGACKSNSDFISLECDNNGKEYTAPSVVELQQQPVVHNGEQDLWSLHESAYGQGQGWVGNSRAVIAAGDADLEGRFIPEDVILTRTEIHRTLEEK